MRVCTKIQKNNHPYKKEIASLKRSKKFVDYYEADTLAERLFDFDCARTALAFLMDIQEFDEATKLVRLKIDELDRRAYDVLRPAAGLLQNVDPLAATLLYRKMIEPVLKNAKSKYYSYAAKDLVACDILSERIADWQGLQDHHHYFQDLQVKNKKNKLLA